MERLTCIGDHFAGNYETRHFGGKLIKDLNWMLTQNVSANVPMM
jgi:hypothetical protein